MPRFYYELHASGAWKVYDRQGTFHTDGHEYVCAIRDGDIAACVCEALNARYH